MGEMVNIEGGEFQQGSPDDILDWLENQNQAFPRTWFVDETPQRNVSVAAFLLDKHPVTNEEFGLFANETGYTTDAESRGFGMVYSGRYWEELGGACWRSPAGPSSSLQGREDHPVVHVSWNDARAYAQWQGKRLPTETEWELAARGCAYRLWPWGDQWDNANANTAETHAGELRSLKAWRKWWLGVCAIQGPVPQTTPVGSFSPQGDSPYGVADLAGNVYEWTNSTSFLYDENAACDPTIRAVMGKYRVIRGGSWMNFRYQARCTERMHGDPDQWSNFATGFRCAQDIEDSHEGQGENAELIVSSAWAQRGGQTDFKIPSGTLGEIISVFANHDPNYTHRLLGEDGQPLNYYNIFINGAIVEREKRLQTVVKPGDKVTIVPPLAGG
jgi:sulfatase modifying factor 1